MSRRRTNLKIASAELEDGSDDDIRDEAGGDDQAGRQFIGALARGLDVLRAFRVNDPPLSNQELARRTGLPRPTISRITYTLTELGYLSYHEQFGCYELGGGVLVLGHVARSNFDMIEKVRPAMRQLAELSGSNVGLGTRDRLSMIYLEAVQGPSRVGLRLEVGSRIPIMTTAMGRAYLAAAPAEEVASLLKQLKRSSKDDPEEPMRTLELARSEIDRYGFCISAGDWQDDIHGIAVAIRAPELGSTFVLNLGGPAYLLPKKQLINEIGPALLRTADEIAGTLGSFSRGARTKTRSAGRTKKKAD